MWRRVYHVLVVLLVVVGVCMVVPELWNAAVDTLSIPHYYAEWHDKLPARPLPTRRGDRERYPRDGFGLVLQYHYFRLDTFAGTATRKLYMEPDTTIELKLSDAQLDALYEAALGMRLFDIPGPLPPFFPDDGILSRTEWLTVRAGTSTKEFAWSRDYPRPEPAPDDWKRFVELIQTVDNMVRSDSGFRALPRPQVRPTD
jgi:hypothetical protein